jgi:hypothetical protein
MADVVPRLALAAFVAVVLGLVLTRVRALPRDLALTGYALVVAILGIYAFLGLGAAAIGGAVIVLVFVVGAVIYGALALVARWADR